MNASLLAVLASPGGGKITVITSTPNNTDVGAVGSGTTKPAGGTPAGSLDKENRLRVRSHAPSFTVSVPPSTPGRMENLRVLIEEGKKAAAEGRLAAALRKYETAMVTLPEAYRPRLRNKIAKLEARLDAEEAGSPRTPGRSSSIACRDAAQNINKDPGVLDFLSIAVQDMSTAVEGGASSSSRPVSAQSSYSPRRSSPLARGLTGSACAIPSVSGAGEVPTSWCDQANQKSSGSHDLDRSTRRLAASSMTTGSTAVGAATFRSPVHSREARERDSNGDHRICATSDGFSSGGAAHSSSPGKGTWKDDGYCGLGGVECEAVVANEDETGREGVDAQKRRRERNKGLSDKLEKQVVDIMNQATSEELTELHGIGPRRAQLILQKRATTPFKTLADLMCIGMYPKQIVKMGRQNILESLDVCHPAKMMGGIDEKGTAGK